MNFLILVFSIILFLHLLVLAAGCFLVIFGLKKKINKEIKVDEEKPFISVLVAARNEEKNIIRCLESLNALNYPKNKLEILIGNDNSEDDTAAIVQNYIKDKLVFRIFDIKENLGTAKGKANVLAHLANAAKGEFIFITDADIAIHPDWINCFLPYLLKPYTFVSGTTIVKGTEMWSSFQELEWILFNAIYRSIDEFHPIAAAGNNMAFSAEAYRKTGGYENMEFSVTEDYQLFKELKKLAYRHRQVLEPECLGLSMPVPGLKSLLEQRKRWLVGGRDLPAFVWLLLSLYALFLPVIIFLFFLSPQTALIFLGLKILLDGIFMFATAGKVKVSFNIILFPLFEVYLYIINILVFIYFFIPGKVKWKGRKY